jgi:hypothetical protein
METDLAGRIIAEIGENGVYEKGTIDAHVFWSDQTGRNEYAPLAGGR